MISITFASGDYRDMVFPLIADFTVSTMREARGAIKKHKGNHEYAILVKDGEALIEDIVVLKEVPHGRKRAKDC